MLYSIIKGIIRNRGWIDVRKGDKGWIRKQPYKHVMIGDRAPFTYIRAMKLTYCWQYITITKLSMRTKSPLQKTYMPLTYSIISFLISEEKVPTITSRFRQFTFNHKMLNNAGNFPTKLITIAIDNVFRALSVSVCKLSQKHAEVLRCFVMDMVFSSSMYGSGASILF